MIRSRSTASPVNVLCPENAAYVVYTSGSTGRSKGILVPHRAVVNHNLGMAALFGLTGRDSVLRLASLSFDAAVEEIFPTWLAGARLVLRPGRLSPSGAELADLAEAQALTVLDLPTAYWHTWVDHLACSGRSLPAALRLVVRGEKASRTC